jgi:hypothetical protein
LSGMIAHRTARMQAASVLTVRMQMVAFTFVVIGDIVCY